MKAYKSGRVVFNGDDIAAAFGMAPPSTRCTTCRHERGDHRREVIAPGPNGSDQHFECQEWDRRTKTGFCKCTQFTEQQGESK